MATIFAWTGALRTRGQLDGIEQLPLFADKLEKACLDTVAGGKMTRDLAAMSTLENVEKLDSLSFIQAIRATFDAMQ